MSAAEPYVHKWLAREPEMQLAAVFSATAARPLERLWGALVNEIEEAACELSDASVAQAKLAWWGDELLHGVRGAARHPLVRDLFAIEEVRTVAAARWSDLALQALLLVQRETPPVDTDAAIAARLPLATSIATIESALFGGGVAARSVAIYALTRALRRALAARGELRVTWPLALVARYQRVQVELSERNVDAPSRAMIADYARSLATPLRSLDEGCAYRRSRCAHDLYLLDAWTRARTFPTEVPALASLLRHWRAARAARRPAAATDGSS